jgi:hypothetical protein
VKRGWLRNFFLNQPQQEKAVGQKIDQPTKDESETKY